MFPFKTEIVSCENYQNFNEFEIIFFDTSKIKR